MLDWKNGGDTFLLTCVLSGTSLLIKNRIGVWLKDSDKEMKEKNFFFCLVCYLRSTWSVGKSKVGVR